MTLQEECPQPLASDVRVDANACPQADVANTEIHDASCTSVALEEILGPGLLPEGEIGTVASFPADFRLNGPTCHLPAYEITRNVNVKLRWRDRPLGEVLKEEFALTREYIQEAAASGRLLLNNCACEAEDILDNGDVITHSYTTEEPTISSEPIAILAENEHVLIVEKPAGLPCHPQGRFQRVSLTEILRHAHLGDPGAYLHPINRLDRGTSGLVILAKTCKAYMVISRELGGEEMYKIYLAKVRGLFRPPSGDAIGIPSSVAAGGWHASCHLPLTVEKHRPNQPLTTVVDSTQGKPATTLFRLLRHCTDGNSLVLCKPVTGRTHQIRVHIASLGFPIVGDSLYGASVGAVTQDTQANPPQEEESNLCLHAIAYALPLCSTSMQGETLSHTLPPPHREVTSPRLAVYRCRRSPAWAV